MININFYYIIVSYGRGYCNYDKTKKLNTVYLVRYFSHMGARSGLRHAGRRVIITLNKN
jgi:hypothetical protein